MKRPLLSLVFALVSPLAFSQTSPDNGETENPVTPRVGGALTEKFSNGETENPITLKVAGATEEFTNGETENAITAKTEGATATTDGFVSAYAADEMIAVFTADGESMCFVIGAAAEYKDTAGQDVDGSVIKEGSKVQVTAETNGDQMVASRIVIDN